MMKLVAKNKKVYYEYEILREFEAGIVLKGWEVKSIRASNISIKEAYVSLRKGEVWLLGAHIGKWKGMEDFNISGIETKTRKLLLNKIEINKLVQGVSIKGNTIVPLNVHIAKKHIKIQIALAKGKKLHDKRQRLKEKDQKRQIDRELKDI